MKHGTKDLNLESIVSPHLPVLLAITMYKLQTPGNDKNKNNKLSSLNKCNPSRPPHVANDNTDEKY